MSCYRGDDDRGTAILLHKLEGRLIGIAAFGNVCQLLTNGSTVGSGHASSGNIMVPAFLIEEFLVYELCDVGHMSVMQLVVELGQGGALLGAPALVECQLAAPLPAPQPPRGSGKCEQKQS